MGPQESVFDGETTEHYRDVITRCKKNAVIMIYCTQRRFHITGVNLSGFTRNNYDTIFLDDILADLNETQKLYKEMILWVAAEK